MEAVIGSDRLTNLLILSSQASSRSSDKDRKQLFTQNQTWTSLHLLVVTRNVSSNYHRVSKTQLVPDRGPSDPGEVVDANFGQHPFVFDIEDYMREWRTKIQAQIDRFPIGEREGEWQSMIQK
ncbi:hypothetical protein INR49_005497 [Caranx melampygus]|nr:hypothetical protein INR49_005497 [Caranx melampygus]